MAAPHPVPLSGTELALLSSAAITPDAAAKPFQVEARIDAARQAAPAAVQLRLWQEALAIAPADARVRVGALRAAITLRRDSLALALEQSQVQPQYGFDPGAPQLAARGIIYGQPRAVILPEAQLTDAKSALDRGIAAELPRNAWTIWPPPKPPAKRIDLRPEARREPLTRKLNGLMAEQDRRNKNAGRQPIVKDIIEQDQVVRLRIPRSQP